MLLSFSKSNYIVPILRKKRFSSEFVCLGRCFPTKTLFLFYGITKVLASLPSRQGHRAFLLASQFVYLSFSFKIFEWVPVSILKQHLGDP